MGRRDRARTSPAASRWWAAPLLALFLLGGLTADHRLFHLPVGDPGSYHARVRRAIESIPLGFGDWVGTETKVQRAAIKLLRPNVILGRRYVNRRTGITASLTIVHCRDARDMGGHYPPVCYPANGWVADPAGKKKKDWEVGGLLLPGMQYAFRSGDFPPSKSIIVYNLVLRPDGVVERDVSSLREAAYDPRKKVYGGGQVQVLFDATVDEKDRDAAFRELIAACLPAIREVLTGATK